MGLSPAEEIAHATVNRVPIPCQTDFADTGADWTGEAGPDLPRRQLKLRAAQCIHNCPIREACLSFAEEQGRYTHGVWGGWYFDAGWQVDPFGLEQGDMKSVYRRVHWDKHRGKWKAEAQRDYKRVHIGYFLNEDDAAAAVAAWEIAYDDGSPGPTGDTGEHASSDRDCVPQVV